MTIEEERQAQKELEELARGVQTAVDLHVSGKKSPEEIQHLIDLFEGIQQADTHKDNTTRQIFLPEAKC